MFSIHQGPLIFTKFNKWLTNKIRISVRAVIISNIHSTNKISFAVNFKKFRKCSRGGKNDIEFILINVKMTLIINAVNIMPAKFKEHMSLSKHFRNTGNTIPIHRST